LPYKPSSFASLALQTNPALDPAALVEARLLFDRAEQGVIVLDHLGFRAP